MTEYAVIATGPLAENCYLLWEGANAWIIDPGADSEEIEAEVTARALNPVAIVLTHGHFDHLGALDALLRRWPDLPVVMRSEERDWAFTHPANQYPPFYFHQQVPASLVEAGETFACGGLEARLIPTPGHTPGGQCILVEKGVPSPLCFTGDTLSPPRLSVSFGSIPIFGRSRSSDRIVHLVRTMVRSSRRPWGKACPRGRDCGILSP